MWILLAPNAMPTFHNCLSSQVVTGQCTVLTATELAAIVAMTAVAVDTVAVLVLLAKCTPYH